MSSFKITQLVVALSLCLLLLSFSYSAEAAARPITDVSEAAVFPECVGGDRCINFDDDQCTRSCRQKGYRWGKCFPTSSSNGQDKIDVNYAVTTIVPCCCHH
ncbi:hypothetical protein MKW92_011578 [Papaver armeniacum]|nr:hypothetical protein MKW92_008391 [Papaver armeniacum]KAI3955190.1 hypothetical protein MKW92_011578 [Papaver armeniacum]